MVNEHTVYYHSSFSESTSRIHPLIFLSTPKEFIFSPEYFLNFFSYLYITPWLQKSLKFMVLRLLEVAFASQKFGSAHFYLCPQGKVSSRFLSLPLQTGGNYTFLLNKVFGIFSQHRGWRIIKLKKQSNSNLQEY